MGVVQHPFSRDYWPRVGQGPVREKRLCRQRDREARGLEIRLRCGDVCVRVCVWEERKCSLGIVIHQLFDTILLKPCT